ncbi:MAG: hypothetical protein ACI89X_001673, partial [Planctomycetota bacterium]
HSDPTGHSTRNPTHKHSAPHSDPVAAIRHHARQNTPRASHPQTSGGARATANSGACHGKPIARSTRSIESGS